MSDSVMTGPAVLSISVTEAGRHRARSLPFAATHGDLATTVRNRWHDTDGFVLFCAVGIAVRIIGPLLADKQTDPAVVAVDEEGRFVVPVCGGHHGRGVSANELATEVAQLLDAIPVVTTATDVAGVPALDQLTGFVATGDVAAVGRALLDGEPVGLHYEIEWPLPAGLAAALAEGEPEPASGPTGAVTGREPGPTSEPAVVVTDRQPPDEGEPHTVRLHPPSLIVGVGASSNASATEAADLLAAVLAEHGLASSSIAAVATIDRRAADLVITSLDLPVLSFSGTDLAPVEVPNPSEVVRREVGTASVAEAAALLGAGPGSELIVEKTKARAATVAIARRAGPQGSVTVVGLGPGHPRHRTAEARTAVRHADVVIGYRLYVDQCADLIAPHQEIVRSPIGAELDRCVEAVERAAQGQQVAMVCSGDPGVFAMATLVLEVAANAGSPPVRIVPGVTASLAAASILGAPLAHDHALISLSDLLTPWPVIERRLKAVAEADLAVAFYNPRSKRRLTQLVRAQEILAAKRPATTPVGVVVNATRGDEQVIMTTLEDFDPAVVDMFSIVVVGSSTTTMVNGRMVTPRGYDS